ncbi:MAG TPA: hypothetical protein VHA77_04440 [Xanthobacteraceae bacterium]|jgi:hypothetical protein|nr:hypothetical protein [Xanthobacteraceae bacterium]
MKHIAYAALACIGFFLVVGIALSLKFAYDGWEVDRFYNQRPILQEMRSAKVAGGADGVGQAGDALLARFPPGTEKVRLILALTQEGFQCGDLRQKWRCQLAAPAQHGGPTWWLIDFQFDDDDRLVTAVVTSYTTFI